ncbi:hypothetical protein TKK_0019300 [Trichogramma kaykai]
MDFCHGQHWLMQGNAISQEEASRRYIRVANLASTLNLSDTITTTMSARPRHVIHCVMAASISLNGNVSLLAGGVNSTQATVRYTSLNNKPDQFYFMLESHIASDEKEEIIVNP